MRIGEPEGRSRVIERLVAEIETPLGGKIFSGGAARETFDGVALMVTGGGSSMRVPVAFLAKNCIMGGTVNRNRLVPAAIAELGSNMLLGQSIGRMDEMVTWQAELGGIRSAVKNCTGFGTVVTGERSLDELGVFHCGNRNLLLQKKQLQGSIQNLE